MASDPQGRLTTIRYPGGYVRAPKANLEALLGPIDISWASLLMDGGGGPRRPYGYRRKANAAGGKPITVVFNSGERYTFRITGTVKSFINEVLSKAGSSLISGIETQRGSEFAPGPFFET